jgi:hypothetical protein
MIVTAFVAIMTFMLPISIYRTIRDFSRKQSISVVFFGKPKIYTGDKAKYILYLNIAFQCLALIGLYVLAWDYLTFNF